MGIRVITERTTGSRNVIQCVCRHGESGKRDWEWRVRKAEV